MKKITLMILVSLVSFFAQAQLFPPESFDAAWVSPSPGEPAAPPQWKVINQFGPNITWAQTIPGNGTQVPFGGTGFSAYLQKETVAPTDAIPADWLVTKPFNMVANAELRFQNKLTIAGDQGGIYKIYIAPAPATSADITPAYFQSNPAYLLGTYTELQMNTGQTDWEEKLVTIPSNAAYPVNSNVVVAFVMEGNNKDRWFLDEVSVTAACVAPTTLVASSTTLTSATLNWTTTASSWEIEIVGENATPTGVGETYNGALPFVKNGLAECTRYKFYVRSICSDGGKSPWVGPTFFKTKCLGETCEAPIVIPPANNYSTTNNTANFADIYEGIAGTGCNSTGNYLAGNDVVYSYTPGTAGNYSITLTNTGGPAGMFIYSSCANIGVSCLNGGTATANAPVNIASMPLTAGTTYYIVISSNGTPQTTPYTLTIQQVFCAQPTAGTATNVNASSATLGWTAGAPASTSWQIAVQPAGTGLPTGAGTTVNANTFAATATTSPTVAPFQPATSYEFYVRESCGGGQFSIWAGPFLFTTSQIASNLDYIQNFDGAPSGFTLGNGTQINKWVVGSATSNSPNNSLYVSNDAGVTNNYTISTTSVVHAYKDIQMPAAVDQLSLTFDWKAFGESCCDYIRVWVVPATFTPTPGTQITAANSGGQQIGGNLNVQTTWQTSNTVITAPPAWGGTVRRLVFEWRNDGSIGTAPAAGIDNIAFKIVTCPQPTALTIANLTPAQANITWTAPSIVPASYDVYVSESSTAPTAATVPTQNVPGTSATISPLTPSATYFVWVRAHCSDTDKSFWTGPVSFNTPQIPATMDYTQNFDAGAHSFTLSNGTQTNKWFVGSATSNSPANSLYISETNGTTNTYNIATTSVVHAYRDIQLPASIASNQILLQFDWKNLGENNFDYIRVWIVPVTFSPTVGTQITAANSGGTQIGGNFQLNGNWTTSTNVIPVPAAWNNTVRRVVFEWRNDGSGGSMPPAAVDNIIFKAITCPAPTALTLGTVGVGTATVNWTAPAGAIVPASYDYYYSTSATAPTDATTPSGNVATTTANITGLAEATNYNVWVRSNCGAGGTSFWIGPLSFISAQTPATLDYAENFDGATSNWAVNNGTQANKWIVGTATFNSAGKSLYISNDDGVTNAYTIGTGSVVHAFRDVALPATTDQLLLQYDWKCVSEVNDYFRVWLVPVTYSPVPGTQITVANSGGIQIGGNFTGSNTWKTQQSVIMASALANSTRRLVFEWNNNTFTGVQPPAAIDNVSLSIITCPQPTNLALTTNTLAGTTFTWTAPAAAPASYDFYYTSSPVPPTEATTPSGNVTGTTVTLPLPNSSNFYFYVRSNCGAGDTSIWTGPINFNTPQVAVNLPFNQDFEGPTPGFSLSNGTQVNKWYYGTAVSNSPTHALYISNDDGVTNQYNITSASIVHTFRDLNIPAGTTELDVAFDWRNVGQNNSDFIRAWLVPATFTPTPGTAITVANSGGVQIGGAVNLQASANWTNGQFVVPATAFSGQAARLVFEWTNNAFTGTQPPGAIDNVSVKVLTCPKPTALTASNIGMTSASLGWTEAGTATNWDVYVVPAGDPAPTDATVGTDAPSNPFTYDVDLVAGTNYQYYVRANCGPGDNSRWAGPFSFNTNVCEVIDQCTIDFILTDSGNNGWGGTTMTVTQNGILVGTLGPQLTAGGGPVTVSFPLCKGLPYDVFFNPGGTSPAQVGLQIVNPFNGQTVFQRIAGTLNSDQNTKLYTGIAFCSDITCPQPTNLASESVVNAPNTTQLNWTPGGTEVQWEVVVQGEGDGFPSDAPVGSVIVDEPEHIVNDLVLGTPYEYYVRAICGPDDKSFWSGPLAYSIFTPPACADVTVVDDELDVIAPDTEYVVCPGEPLCIDFSASFYVEAAETTSYEVTSIPFTPPFPTLGGTPMPVGQDDIWSPRIVLPFEFCFFGQVYNAAQVGANGLLSFNADQPAGGGSGYSFNQTIPNPTFPQRNAIYGVYQDTNPAVDNAFANPNINYQVLGNYPCRALVVSFNELAQFSGTCQDDPNIGAQSSQIVIYEITNIIEVYVKRRVPCPSWQNGVGLIGVQNAGGTAGFTPPDRNTGAWTAMEEAWRFTPNGETTATFEWLKDGDFYSSDTDINVCAEAGTTVMTARASYSVCNGETVVRESDFTIRVEEQIIPAEEPADITKCGNGEEVTFDLNEAVADVFEDPTGYVFTFYATEQDAIDGGTNNLATDYVTTETATVWVRIMRDGLPCFITDSFQVIVSNQPPVFTLTADASICEGSSATIAVTPGDFNEADATYTWTLDGNPIADTTSTITVTEPGIYEVTVNRNGCIGTASSTLTVVPLPVADAPADVTVCGEYILPALSANNNYYTATGGAGTQLSAGDSVGSTQTIFVYAVSPDLATCTDENSFVVTVNTVPVIDSPVADLAACDSYTLPALGANESYYTAPDGPNGSGTMLNAGDVIVATQTIYVYEETGTTPNCFAEASFTVTVSETPVADTPADVTVCDGYVLPALSAGNNYYTGPGATGTMLSAGETVSSTQLVYVYAVAVDNALCFSESSFTVSVTPTPQFNLGGPYVTCVASNLVVSVNGANFNDADATFEWTINGVPAGTNSSSISATEFGTYQLTVTVGTCSHTETVEVTQDTTEILLAITDSCDGNVYSISVSDADGAFNIDNATFAWTGPNGFTSTDREIFPQDTGDYTVVVTTENGCIAEDIFPVASTTCDIPRGISPNNDGLNDNFDLTALGVKKLSIFNRYGQEVYSRNNYKDEFIGQGSNGDELPTGTYFYMIERSTGETKTGWVYINRQE